MTTQRKDAPCPFGPEFEIYWSMRYELFSRFDEGIRTDAIGLRSVCPEKAALEIGAMLRGEVVMDAFCGIGGTAIGLARSGKRVIAIDRDPARLEMAADNAKIYGVAGRITFVCGDTREEITRHPVDAVFMDIPWGGPAYRSKPLFGLRDFLLDGVELLRLALPRARYVALRVPYNFNFQEFAPLRRDFHVHWFRMEVGVAFATVFLV